MALLWFAFFLSGVAGLSYELTWVRYLTQLFGASTPAVSATVAIFFSGLALGAWLGGKVFDRSRRPAHAYAVLELLIGIAAVCVPFLFALGESVLAAWLREHSSESSLLLLFASAVILLGPTTLLGATFPAMAAVVRNLSNPTQSTGYFYGFNTLGAVLGCLLVSFWCLPVLGQRMTTWVMSSVNLSIALFFWLMSSRLLAPLDTPQQDDDLGKIDEASGDQVTEERPPDKEGAVSAQEALVQEGEVRGTTTGELKRLRHRELSAPLAYWLAGGSGFLAIAIEVLWTRALVLSFPASVYIFALVLAAYLVGIGVGSVASGFVFRERKPHAEGLLVLYLIVAMGCVLTLWLFPKLTPWSLALLKWGWIGNWSGYLGWMGTAAVLAMLPATLAMGAALPLLIGLVVLGQGHLSQSAGRLYALNTLGGVLGSLLVTFVMMPRIGLTESLIVLALGYAILSLSMALSVSVRRVFLWSASALVIGGIVALWAGVYPRANPLKYRPSQRLLFYRDTASATISIYEHKVTKERSLRVNNYYGLSNTSPETVLMQYRLGHLAMLLHPQPKRALLIGFATGTTLAAIARHPHQRVDCVELHGSIFKLAHFFEQANRGVWKRSLYPNVRLIAADGRRFLRRRGTGYDVIVGDLYLPRNPGVGALYSIEHFRSVYRRLQPGGVFVAWLPMFQLGPQEMASIIRTYLKVFPNAEGWVSNWSPQRPILGLVGRRGGKPFSPIALGQRLNAYLQAMHDPKVKIPPTLPAPRVGASSRPTSQPTGALQPKTRETPSHRRLLTAKMLARWGAFGQINRIERPIVEFGAPKAMLEAKLQRYPLSLQNIHTIAKLRSLRGTPWESSISSLLPRK